MKAFQQMSIACSFQESLLAYHGEELNEEQLEALQIIYKSTKPWMLGAVVGNLMDRINNQKITNKDFAIAVSTILDQLSMGESEGTAKATSKMKGLVFELANIEDKS